MKKNVTMLQDNTRLITREGEDGFTCRESEYRDLRRHVEAMQANESSFWTGLQWSVLGGSFSAIIATGGYQLFDSAPNKFALTIGYMVSAGLFVIFLILIFRDKGKNPSFAHHKEEAMILLKRIAAEGWRTTQPEPYQFENVTAESLERADMTLFTDLRNTKDKLGKDA